MDLAWSGTQWTSNNGSNEGRRIPSLREKVGKRGKLVMGGCIVRPEDVLLTWGVREGFQRITNGQDGP